MIIMKLALVVALTSSSFGSIDSIKVHVPDKIVLSIHQYPMRQTIDYTLSYNNIKIILCNRNKNHDSILVTKDIRLKRFSRMAKKITSFEKEKYANPCILDGQVFSLKYFYKDSVLKTIIFSNYYEAHLAKVINLINHHVKRKYYIPYNKNKLIKASKNCDQH